MTSFGAVCGVTPHLFPIDVSIGLLKLRSGCARGVRGAQPGNLGRIGASWVDGVCVCVPVAPDRSPSYTNFSQPNIGSKSPKFSRRFAPKYSSERFKSCRQKSQKFRRESRAEISFKIPFRTLQNHIYGFPGLTSLRKRVYTLCTIYTL